jgi:hypothetical protein
MQGKLKFEQFDILLVPFAYTDFPYTHLKVIIVTIFDLGRPKNSYTGRVFTSGFSQ